MRKHQARLVLCLITVLVSGILYSCSGDDVDAGYLSGEFSLDFATVRLENSAPILALDDEDTLRSTTIASFDFTQKSGQRVIVNHSPDTGDGIVIHSITDILTSQIYKASFDTLHTDAVKVQSIWVGGGYLNMILYMNYYSKTHKFGLFRSPDDSNQLQLSHDKQGDSEGYPVKIYLSFLLSGFSQSSDGSTSFSVNIPLSDGLKEYTFSY